MISVVNVWKVLRTNIVVNGNAENMNFVTDVLLPLEIMIKDVIGRKRNESTIRWCLVSVYGL